MGFFYTNIGYFGYPYSHLHPSSGPTQRHLVPFSGRARDNKEQRPGFKLPTGPAKPAGSGTGIPDRFGRKSVQTG